jgi:hypothetical protein
MAPLHEAGKAADYSSCNSLCQERSRKVLNAVSVCLSLCVSVCLLLVWGTKWWRNDVVLTPPHPSALCPLNHHHNRRHAITRCQNMAVLLRQDLLCPVITGQIPRMTSYVPPSPSTCSSSTSCIFHFPLSPILRTPSLSLSSFPHLLLLLSLIFCLLRSWF